MRRTTTPRTDSAHRTEPTTGSRASRARDAARERARRRAVVGLALAVGLGGIVAPATAGVAAATSAVGGVSTLPGPDVDVRPMATIENEEEWCSYLSSYYLAFPSPWSARVYNCRHSAIFIAPLFSDGSRGLCVLVPARHSRHLGGNVAKWVTDIGLC